MFKALSGLWLNRSIRAKGAAVITVPLMCLMVLVVWFTGLERHIQKAQEGVAHTQEIRQEAWRLMASLAEADVGIQGYVTTGSRQLIDSSAVAAGRVPKALDKLSGLVRNPAQRQRLSEIRALAEGELGNLTEQKALLASAGWQARKWRELGNLVVESERRMGEIRRRISQFLADEEARLRERAGEVERRQTDGRGVLLVALGIGMCGGLLAAWLFSSGVASRLSELERNAQRLAIGLPLGPAFAGSDEMSRVNHQLHVAATIIEKREQSLRESIARQKEVEDELQELYAQKEAILNSVGEGLCGVDAQGNITFVNPAGARMLGYQPEDVIGKPAHPLVHHTRADGSPYPAEECTIRAALRDGKLMHRDDEVFWRTDGTSIPVEYTTAPHCRNGQVVGAVLIFRDITERQRLQESLLRAKALAEQASRAKSDFLAYLSHELRTPLSVVVGAADLLAETALDENQRQQVNMLESASEALQAVANDILDLSNVEAGRLQLDAVDFDLQELIRNAVEFVSVHAQSKGLQLNWQILPGLGTGRRGDPQRIRQVIVNLLENAIQFTAQGEVKLTVCPEADDSDAHALRFAVSDTGVGIADGKLATIFETFPQADASSTHAGTGLGLSICRGLVELMGGRIWAERKAKGSTFNFTVRLKPGCVAKTVLPAIAPTPGPQGKPAMPAGSEKPVRILAVEDAPVNMLLIESYLKGPAFLLDSATNGAIAVEKFQSGEYDVVLMDVQMPVMDGYTATRTIREWEREMGKRPTPILALTAHAFAEEEQKSFSAGCNAHLVKPIRKAALLEAIHAHAGRVLSSAPQRAAPAGKISVRAPAGIEEAIPLFLDITRTDVQSLAEALRAADYSKIRFIGHDLKGSGGGYGFDEITNIGRSIEEAAKRSDGEEIRRQLAALNDYLDRVEVIYE